MSEIPQAQPQASKPFARRFRVLMGWHDLTLREIASATNNALSTVGTWKNGRVPSSPQTLERLAEIFQVPVDYLLTGQLHEAEAEAISDEAAGRILHDLSLLSRALDLGHLAAQDSPAEVSQRTKRTRPPP